MKGERIYFTQTQVREMFRYMENSNWINEDDACNLLGWKKRTLASRVSDGTIPPDHFRTGIRGKRFFDKAFLIGIKKPAVQATGEKK